jgi:hypothetical protein
MLMDETVTLKDVPATSVSRLCPSSYKLEQLAG